MKRRLALLTTGRQDWGILRSTARWLAKSEWCEPLVLAGGMALSKEHGAVAEDVEGQGLPVLRVPFSTEEPAPVQAGEALAAIAGALESAGAAAILLVGDRFETAAGALAATLARVPIVHLHGGEQTEGAIDNALRSAITKLAHLHLVSHPDHARAVEAMGEDPASVHVVGAPGLDNLHRSDLPGRAELEAVLGLALVPPVVIVTLHPATLGAPPLVEAEAVAAAMDRVKATYVVTLPNVDPGASIIRERLSAAARSTGRVAVDALGERRFWGLMKIADGMLGNSSSALIEAPALHLPAVNVGERQRGRLRGPGVVDAPPEPGAVAEALARILRPEFRTGLSAGISPFGDGHSAERIGDILRSWSPPSPPVKRSWRPE